MLNYRPVREEDAELLRSYYEHCDYGLCEYSVGTKLMWADILHPTWAEAAGCLIVRNTIEGKVAYDYPVPGPDGDEEAALAIIEGEWLEQAGAPMISVVPRCKTAKLLERYPYVKVGNIRNWRDYVYHTEDLQNFAGRRYSGQRNHIKKFKAACPEAEFRPLTSEDAPAVEIFWQDYGREFAKAEARLRDAQEVYLDACAAWEQAKHSFEKKQKAYFDEQAGILARNLVPGMPCPVCGSREHPVPAPLSEAAPTREELDRSKAALNRAEAAMSAAGTEAASRKAICAEKQSALQQKARQALSVPDLEDLPAALEEAKKKLTRKAAVQDEQIRLRKAQTERKAALDRMIPEKQSQAEALQERIGTLAREVEALKA